MQQQEFDHVREPDNSTQPDLDVTETQEQEEQHQLSFIQKLQMALTFALQIVTVLSRAAKNDEEALQIQDGLLDRFQQLGVSAASTKAFKDRLEKLRQRDAYTRLEDVYLMGGILIHCGILMSVLTTLGAPDVPLRLAWQAFAVSLPCTVGFFLVRFIKKKNGIAHYGWIHSILALLAEIGIVITTIGIFYHILNSAGWIFLVCTLVLFLGYQRYRWTLYYGPFLGIFQVVLKELAKTASAKMP